MTNKFNVKLDYLLPIGAFAEKFIGDDISPSIKENAAKVQSLLVVFAKYLIPKGLTIDNQINIEEQKKKLKDDFMLENMHRDYIDLKNQLMEIIPNEVDANQEIKLARELVDSGIGVPNVPPFGAILSKNLSRHTVNSCLQVQAGLRVFALIDGLPNNEKIQTARIFDNDPRELKHVQSVMNYFLANYVSKQLAMPDEVKKAARIVADLAIVDAMQQLRFQGNDYAVGILAEQLQSTSYNNYAESVKNFFDIVNPNKPRDIGNKLKL